MTHYIRLFLSLLCIGVATTSFSRNLSHVVAPQQKVSFFEGMEWDLERNAQYKERIFTHTPDNPSRNPGAFQTMMLFKELYEKNNFFDRPAHHTPRIPKIIHQIWFGPKTPPAIFKESQKSLKKHNPDWEYKLWTEDDIPGLQLQNQQFYDLSTNYAEKADIVRYELLNKFGGVYADVDFVCLKPFDVLTQYEFWAGCESLDCENPWILSNAIIGAVPGHPILRHAIDTIQQSWYRTSDTFLRVGPAHLSESVVACARIENPHVIIFPKTFFYALDFKYGLSALKDKLNYSDIDAQIRPETFAMHYWAGTWWRKDIEKDHKESEKEKERLRRHKRAAQQRNERPISKKETRTHKELSDEKAERKRKEASSSHRYDKRDLDYFKKLQAKRAAYLKATRRKREQ